MKSFAINSKLFDKFELHIEQVSVYIWLKSLKLNKNDFYNTTGVLNIPKYNILNNLIYLN